MDGWKTLRAFVVDPRDVRSYVIKQWPWEDTEVNATLFWDVIDNDSINKMSRKDLKKYAKQLQNIQTMVVAENYSLNKMSSFHQQQTRSAESALLYKDEVIERQKFVIDSLLELP